jgi:phosphatidylglycerol---prolipoprotein diacylglyceryl transferase
MYPTLFKIPYLPDWLADVKSYGVMMMIAFLSGIWLCCRRADRSRANADIELNIGFIALIFGVAGARAMFVMHYWDTRFANQPNPFAAIFDIRAGGLEFWGGPLLAIPAAAIYLRYIAKVSPRWYLDITVPSLAWGLAITRIGCFLNGCCWGSTCIDEHDPAWNKPALPWAVRFPYGSPAMAQQYQFGQLTLPKELIFSPHGGESYPLSREFIDAALKDEGRTSAQVQSQYQAAITELTRLQNEKADPSALKAAKDREESARKALMFQERSTQIGVVEGQARKYGLSVAELAELAHAHHSKPVHPTQLYEFISAMLICWFLTVLFYYRRRHGILLGWFLILYSISRLLLEAIRQDNPLDVGGLTISQAISVGCLAAGLLWLWIVYTKMPLVSPLAVPFEPPEIADDSSERRPRETAEAPMARRR